MSEYNMQPMGLFGKRCMIKNVHDMEKGFVYRIVNSGVRSNCWKELPLGRYGNEAIQHDHMEDIVYVVCDTLIDEMSKIERVALKDIEIMEEPTVPAIPIPEGATNGDMIKAVFGAEDIDEDFVMQIVTVTMSGERKAFGRAWWYTSYKKEGKE